VSGFDAAWLALREPYDHGARSAELARRFAAALAAAPYLIDLGCGTGSNLRYLGPRIRGPQRWLCVDHDPALLDAARATLTEWGTARGWPSRSDGDVLTLARPDGAIAIGFALADLARDGLPERRDIGGVTGAALLDLVSAAWLTDLASWSSQLPVLIALSFDGRLAFEPAAAEDRTVRERFAAHQRSDKGFGPALGADAAQDLAAALAARGWEVALAPADWRLGPADRPLLAAMLEGIVGAAGETAHDPDLERWAALRRKQLAAGDLRLTVGHLDLLALPA
jgi:SAM-dependent methyltransferase